MEKGALRTRRVATVARMIVDAYGGHDGGKGSAMARSSSPSDSVSTAEPVNARVGGRPTYRRGRRPGTIRLAARVA
jgi:hypothetical protein